MEKALTTILSSGGSVKFLYDSLAGSNASGFGPDMSVVMRVSETISVRRT